MKTNKQNLAQPVMKLIELIRNLIVEAYEAGKTDGRAERLKEEMNEPHKD